MALSQIITGILILCNFSESSAGVIAGSVVTIIPAVVYMVVEGKIDAARAKTSVLSLLEAIDELSEADLLKVREKIKALLDTIS